MGLEEFKSDNSDDESDVSTRKKPENVTFNRESLARVITSHPPTLYVLASGTGESGVKALVQMAQNIVDGNHHFDIGKYKDTSDLEHEIEETTETFLE
jgi:hypothetical protein